MTRWFASTVQIAGLLTAAYGLSMLAPWLGVTFAGLSVTLLGVAGELRRDDDGSR